jgi:hypothetical protein
MPICTPTLGRKKLYPVLNTLPELCDMNNEDGRGGRLCQRAAKKTEKQPSWDLESWKKSCLCIMDRSGGVSGSMRCIGIKCMEDSTLLH